MGALLSMFTADRDGDSYKSMFAAARDGDLHSLKMCVKKLGKDKAKRLTSVAKVGGQTPLVIACREGHAEVVEYLIDECGADIELKGMVKAGGMKLPPAPPLWWASAGGHLNVVRSLLNRGANINSVGASGRSALHAACSNGELVMVRHLVENGADVEAADRNKITCLGMACHEEHYQVATYLMQKDLNGRLILNNLCWLSTMFTLMQSNGKSVDFEVIMDVFVVALNAIEVQTKSGEKIQKVEDKVVLHLIGCIIRMQPGLSEEQNKSFGEVLKRYVRFDRDKQGGWTPLHMICFLQATDEPDLLPYSMVNVVKELLDAGANPKAVDHKLDTPLHYVAKARPISLDIIRLLLDRGAHFDARNAKGKCFVDLLAPEDRAQFNPFHYTDYNTDDLHKLALLCLLLLLCMVNQHT